MKEMNPGPPLTYEDYAKLPADGRRYQVLDGELYVTAAPTTHHQKISFRLGLRLGEHVETRDLGLVLQAPIDVLLGRHGVVQPDLLFVEKSRLAIVEDELIRGAPDVVVEVLSPSTRELDRRKKAQVYAAHGVAWYWLVDGETKSIAEWKLSGGSFVLRVNATQGEFVPEAFPGLAIDLAWLFRP